MSKIIMVLAAILIWGGLFLEKSLAYTDTITGQVETFFSQGEDDDVNETCGPTRVIETLLDSEVITDCIDSNDPCLGPSCTQIIRETYQEDTVQDCLVTTTHCEFVCSHTNVYNYPFRYEVNQNSTWTPIASTELHKCEDVRVVFEPIADWGGGFNTECVEEQEEYTKIISSVIVVRTIGTPPTDLLNCSGQEDCLNQATEYPLDPETQGKGVQMIPENFIEDAQKSLFTPDDYAVCNNGICTTYAAGEYAFNTTAANSTYYGQCSGYGITVNTPGVDIGSVRSDVLLNTINQAPLVITSIDQDQVWPSDEVLVNCDVVDPDCADDPEHQDHIVKVKWNCYDEAGNIHECQLKGDGIWRDGEFIQEGDFGNPANFQVYFRSPVRDTNYIISCEAWDNDPRDPKSSRDNDQSISEVYLSVIPANNRFCTMLSDDSEKLEVICGNEGVIDFVAFPYGLKDNPVYNWNCGNGTTCVNEGAEKRCSCSYSSTGEYAPTLTISDSVGNLNCPGQADVKVTNDSTCTVVGRKKGSNDSYSTNINVASDDKIELKVNRECMKEGDVTWSVINGTINEDGDTAIAKINKGGSVSASIEGIDCGSVNVDITSKIRWGEL